MPKKDQARPVISCPVGPIKSSRGPDLVRSDRFRIVDGIDDCQDPSATEASSGVTPSMAAKTTRRVSASFSGQERPAASPTVASSSINATTPALAPPAPSSSRFLRRPSFPSFPSFGRSKSSKSLLPTSSTASMLPTGARQAENVHPAPSFKPPVVATPQLPQQASKLPKSRTMNVLHDLRNSISRQNLGSRFNDSRRTPTTSQMPQHPRPHPMPPPSWNPALSQMPQVPRPPALPQTSASSRVSAPSHNPGPPYTSAQLVTPGPSQQHAIRRKPVPSQAPGPSRPPVALRNPGPMPMSRQPSQVSPMPIRKAPSALQPPQANPPGTPKPCSAFSLDSSRSSTPEPDRSQVVEAQPMEYWTGRFSRLNDIYLADDRGPETLLALRSGLLSQHRQHVDPQSVDEDDARHLHIFAQLDFLCATQDAKQSLWEFQQVFARRFHRAIILPEGGSMGGQHQLPVSRLPGNRHSSVEGRGSGPSRPPSSQTMGSNAGGPYGTR